MQLGTIAVTRSVRFISAATVAMAIALLTNVASATASPAVYSTLPVEVSSGETEPPPDSTELPACKELNPQAPALGEAMDNPQITKVEGGGKKYSYALPGLAEDEYMTVNEPPAGFDPLTASSAELELWGFPPRPSNESAMEEWRELVGPYEEASFNPGCEGQEYPSKGYLGESQDPGWSGYEAVSSSYTFYRTAVGEFNQPFETSNTCGRSAAVASWVGLGGDKTERFMQTGTEANGEGLYNENSYNAWIEIYAGSYNFPYIVPGAFVWPNQSEEVYVGYDYNSETAYFYDINQVQGKSILTEWHLGHQFYDGSTAEWIEEAPGNLNLLDFASYMKWRGAEDQTQNYAMHALNAYNYEKDAANKGNGVYQWPGALEGNEEFPDFFYGCR